MSQESVYSLIRSVLTFVGSYIIGHAIFGVAITSTVWDVIGGSVISLIGIVWGIVEKTATVDSVSSAIRSVFISIGGVLVAAGKVSQNSLNQIEGIATAALPIIQSWISRSVVKQIATGSLIPSSTTGKVTPSIPPAK